MHKLPFLMLTAVAGADDGLMPWLGNTQPTDRARSHVEEITAGRHKYTVVQSGTMDGRNCRSPMGCGIAREGAMLQTWESNRSVRMENVGEIDVVHPWLSKYGYNTCGNDSICLATLWRKAGLKVAPARVLGHCVSQAFYDNRWHLHDGDMHSVYLLRDNETVAGEQDIVREN